jgi:hypothetical protein
VLGDAVRHISIATVSCKVDALVCMSLAKRPYLFNRCEPPRQAATRKELLVVAAIDRQTGDPAPICLVEWAYSKRGRLQLAVQKFKSVAEAYF